VQIGDLDYAGNVTHLTYKVEGHVRGYLLMVYGDRRSRGLDVKGDQSDDKVIPQYGRAGTIKLAENKCAIPTNSIG
jgi:hypothetical protein